MDELREILFDTAKLLTERMDEIRDKLSKQEQESLDQLKNSLIKYEQRRSNHGEMS